MRAYGGVVAIVVAIMTTLLTVSGPAARADTPAITLDVKLDLNADGVLAVTTTAAVPQGASAVGTVPLQVPVEANRTQHFAVSDIAADGGASAAVQGDALVISVPGGTSTVRYSVRGTVADGTDLQQFTWVIAAGWSAPIEKLTGRFSSPTAKPDSPICAYGQIGVRRLCSLTQTDLDGSVSFQNNNLASGDVAVFSVLLPADTATATAEFTPTVTEAGPARTPRDSSPSSSPRLLRWPWPRLRGCGAGPTMPPRTACSCLSRPRAASHSRRPTVCCPVRSGH